MFKTIVQQTIEDRGNKKVIEKTGPFPCADIANSYLGSGYYFWDDHIDIAHWWGKNHVKGHYMICEGDFEVAKSDFFDLVGSRQDMKNFNLYLKRFGIEHLSIGNAIEFLKQINSEEDGKGVFPYKVIRALDLTENSYFKHYKKFANRKIGQINLNPQILICMIEKNALILQSYKVIYPH